jgi:hypothetical protein
MGRPLQITDSGKPIQIHCRQFSRISRWKDSVIYSDVPLLTDSGNWRTANNLFDLQREAYSAIDTIAASLFLLSAGWLTIAAGAPLNWISHLFWLKPLKSVF